MNDEQRPGPAAEPPIEALRDFVRELVKESSYREMARRTDVSPETIRKFILGEGVPGRRTVERLARLLPGEAPRYVRDAPAAPYGTALGPSHGSRASYPARPYPRRAQRPPAAGPPHALTDADRVSVRLHSARRAFESDAGLAGFLGVDRAQPARWRAGQAPDPVNLEKIVALDVVVELLSGYLSPSSIPKWLNGVNAHLGNRRPIAVLRAGHLSEVIAAIEAERSGAYA